MPPMLRAIVRRLRRRLTEDRFRPRYAEGSLPAILAKSQAGRGSALLRSAQVAERAGRRSDAMAIVVRHFDERNSKLCFAHGAGDARHGTQTDERQARWLASAAEQAKAFIEVSLPVYGVAGPPLRPGYPWHGPTLPGPQDLLLAVCPHRFAFAPRLALGVRAGAISVSDFDAVVADWMAFARTQPRLPFISNLVVVQRLIASTWAFHFLAGVNEGAALLASRYRLLSVIEQDVAFLLPRLGDSFPNNHLLVDRFAAWFIALHYAELQRNDPDLDALEAQWLAELHAQTYEDGGGIEHSVHYHGLACEMAAMYTTLARASGRPVAEATAERVRRMLRLQADLCGPDGRAPNIGDSSEDPLFPLDDGRSGNAAAYREVYRALVDPGIPPLARTHPARERAFWISGGREASEVGTAARGLAEYPDAGFTVFFDHDETTRCVLRTGPSDGARTLPGHLHADALSVTLIVHGRPMLVDAGTGTYRFRRDEGTTNWRDYFAGPRAHNGLVAGDVNPLGPLRGDFRSKAELPTVVRVAGEAGSAVAFQESRMTPVVRYPGLTRGVIHLRGAGFIVYDIVDDAAPELETHFAMQLDAGCSAHVVGDAQVTLRNAGVEVSCAWSAGLAAPDVVTGRAQPPNGWISRTYAERTPAPQLLFGLQSRSALTAFAMYGDVHDARLSLQCARTSPDTRGFCIDAEGFRDYVLVNIGRHDAQFSQWGITFRGRLAWIRVPDGGPPQLRWLAGTACEAPALGLSYRFDQVAAELVR